MPKKRRVRSEGYDEKNRNNQKLVLRKDDITSE